MVRFATIHMDLERLSVHKLHVVDSQQGKHYPLSRPTSVSQHQLPNRTRRLRSGRWCASTTPVAVVSARKTPAKLFSRKGSSCPNHSPAKQNSRKSFTCKGRPRQSQDLVKRDSEKQSTLGRSAHPS